MVGSGFRAHLKVPTCSGTRPNKKRGPIFGSHHPSSLESQVVPSSSKIFWRTSSTFTALCTESAHPRSITPLSAWVLCRYFDFKALWRMWCGHPARLEKREIWVGASRGVHSLFWSWGNPERSNARYNYSPEGTASRSRHFTSLGGQLKCKDDQGTRNLRPQVKIRARAFDFCLSTSIPVLTTSTYVVAWPQGDQLLGGSPWHKAILPTTQ